jgi:hypothetical protein
MEHNPGYSMKTFHVLCESQFCEGIGKKMYGEQKDEDWRNIYIYIMLIEEYHVEFFLVKKGS